MVVQRAQSNVSLIHRTMQRDVRLLSDQLDVWNVRLPLPPGFKTRQLQSWEWRHGVHNLGHTATSEDGRLRVLGEDYCQSTRYLDVVELTWLRCRLRPGSPVLRRQNSCRLLCYGRWPVVNVLCCITCSQNIGVIMQRRLQCSRFCPTCRLP